MHMEADGMTLGGRSDRNPIWKAGLWLVQCCSLVRIRLHDHRAQGDSSGSCIPYPGEGPPPRGSPTFTGIWHFLWLVSAISVWDLGST